MISLYVNSQSNHHNENEPRKSPKYFYLKKNNHPSAKIMSPFRHDFHQTPPRHRHFGDPSDLQRARAPDQSWTRSTDRGEHPPEKNGR